MKNINFEETITEDNQNLVLNGVGVRTYMFVDVYVAALYLSEKKQSNEEILKIQTPKIIRMHFFRSVSKSDMIKAWKYSFETTCKTDCKIYSDSLERFYSSVTDVKDGDEIIYVFNPKFVEIRTGNKTDRINQEKFGDVLISTWLGPNPPTESLKNGLLGKK